MYDVIVIGAGPGGLTAAIYTARAGLKTLVIDQKNVGGQIYDSSLVENYPGVKSIPGSQLTQIMKEQAQSFGAEIMEYSQVLKVDLKNKIVSTMMGQYTAKSIIIATGARERKLNIPGENEFKGRGISYCSTCDGPFFKDKEIIVIGGGNSALEESLYLTKFVKHVYIMYRSRIKAEKFIYDKVKKNKKISFIPKAQPIEFLGDKKLERIKYKDLETGEIKEMKIDGVFIYIGMLPNTELFEGQIELNKWKYIVVDKETRTSIPGIFAIGDVTDSSVKQVATAVGDGAKAGVNVYKYLEEEK